MSTRCPLHDMSRDKVQARLVPASVVARAVLSGGGVCCPSVCLEVLIG